MTKRSTYMRLLAMAVAILMLGGLCACGETVEDPVTASREQVAEKFIKAYRFGDRLTTYPMYFHDMRRQKEDELIKLHGSAEAFFSEVQQQADEKGIEVDIHSFDDYYAAFYEVSLKDFQAAYGDYTVTTEVTESTKMDADTFATFCDAQLGSDAGSYMDADALRAVTEAYTLDVHILIDGTIKDYSESYLVHLVLHEGQWRVVSHSI